MAGYPMVNIINKKDEINKHLRGVPYALCVNWDDFLAWKDKQGKAHFVLQTDPDPSWSDTTVWYDTTVWVIDFDAIDAGRLDLKLQEIVKFEDGWLQRLLGLANEWMLDALPGE